MTTETTEATETLETSVDQEKKTDQEASKDQILNEEDQSYLNKEENHAQKEKSYLEEDTNKTQTDDSAYGKPNKYDFKDVDLNINDNTYNTLSELSSELNLSQESANKVLKKLSDVVEKNNTEAVKNLHKQWSDEVKADENLSSNLDEHKSYARKAVNKFANKEFVKFITDLKLENNKHILNFLSNVGRSTSEEEKIVKSDVKDNQVQRPKNFYDYANVLYKHQT